MVFWIGAAALMIEIYVGTKGSGQGLGQFWKKNGGTVVDDIYVPIGAKDVVLDQVNKTCKSRGDATSGGPARKAATYVACLAAENPKRLCRQPTARTLSPRCGTTIACRRKAARRRSEPNRKSRRRARP